jgi:parallel beta-helix repeat protein
MFRKIVVVWVSLILIFSFTILINKIEKSVEAQEIYVDDDGIPGVTCNYTTIQEAINNSRNGDTIYVWEGTYFENVIVNKTVTIIGNGSGNTTIDAGIVDICVLVTTDWVNITGVGITRGGNEWDDSGIKFENVQNCSLYSTKIFNNYRKGIFITNSLNIEIYNNNISLNENTEIDIAMSSEIKIIGNNISGWSRAIYLSLSSNNDIIDNNISNTVSGVVLSSSQFTNMFNNDLINCGVVITGSVVEDFNSHTIPLNNTVNGEPLYYYKNKSNIIIDGTPMGELIIVNCTDFDVKNLQINNTTVGIELAFTMNINISNNDIYSNILWGILLVHPSTRFNNITNNNIIDNNYGIRLEYSINNNITYNNVIDNGYGIDIVWDSDGNIIAFNNVTSNSYGIDIMTDDNIIYGNNISNNSQNGIWMRSMSHDNIAWKNNISNNKIGINVEGILNRIYHNNIVNNTDQADDTTNDGCEWDNGYPSGGNYWSDYTGNDSYKGPNQDQPGSDGIGDTNYSIDSDSIDNYPLMEPYTDKPIENMTILMQGWNLISIPLIQEDKNLPSVLGSIDTWYDAVQWFDTTDSVDLWKHHKIGKPFGNDLFDLNETMGFWVHIIEPRDIIFVYNGTEAAVNQTIDLNVGWNQVGYPSLTSYNRTEGLNGLDFGTEINAIQWFDAATKTWHFMGPDDNFIPGRGYWMHSKVDVEWKVPI